MRDKKVLLQLEKYEVNKFNVKDGMLSNDKDVLTSVFEKIVLRSLVKKTDKLMCKSPA